MKKLKLCLIGNSHLGCFKTGWDAISGAYPGVEMKFYPHCGNYYDMFRVDTKAGLLHVDNDFVRSQFDRLSGNGGTIRPESFDLCLIVGGITAWGGVQGVYSLQVQQQAALDFFESSNTHLLVDKIRKLSSVEINCVHNPLEALREKPVRKVTGYDYLSGISLINEMIGEKYNATLFSQPTITMTKSNTSRLEYAAGERLTGASLVKGAKQEIIDDLVHMNAAYGALFLSEILAKKGIKAKNLSLPKPDGHLPFVQRQNMPPK